MATRKPRKTPQSPKEIPMVVPKHGRGLLRVGGTNPGSGRPPDEFKAMCRELASGDETQHVVAAILKDKTHPAFIGALKWATEHGYGKPKETVEHTGKDGGAIQVWVFGDKKVEF